MTRPKSIRIGPILVLLAVVAVAPGFAAAQTPEVTARHAYLLDATGDRVLIEKAADESMAPSSMAKMMTQYLIFEALGRGEATIWTPVRVSRRASQQPGSGIDLRADERLPLGVLLQASIVYSANDATVALAEHFDRSEADFARRMTVRARELGLERSVFANATGFTHRRQSVTARDLAQLALLLMRSHPEWYRHYATRSFRFRGEAYENRNPVLGRVAGADGVKTGQTRAGGFGLVASAEREGRRIVLVLNGLESAEARADEAVRLLEWAFQQGATRGG